MLILTYSLTNRRNKQVNKTETREYYKSIVGSDLSNTSKMPCVSFNLSARHCKTGSKLVNVKGSVCEGCYAMKGFYRVYGWIDKMTPKTEKIDNPLWTEAMVWLINNQLHNKDKGFFRWHDSGDLQSVEHLEKIAEVCRQTPTVKHWLPTREYKIVDDWAKQYDQPSNLAIRKSVHMIDGKLPKVGLSSSVHKESKAQGTECKAYNQKGQCLDCRLCWNTKVKNISYKYH